MTTPDPQPSDIDPIHQGMRTGTRAVLEHIARTSEWDSPPVLCVVAHGGVARDLDELGDFVPNDILDAVRRDTAGRDFAAAIPLVLREVPVPEWIWLAAPVPEAIDALAHAFSLGDFSDQLGLPEGARVAGLVLITEAWVLKPRTASMPVDEATSLRDHPDSIERRVATGVDTAGAIHSVAQRRDTGAFEDMPHGGIIGGRVPDGLRRLLTALAEDPDAELAREGS